MLDFTWVLYFNLIWLLMKALRLWPGRANICQMWMASHKFDSIHIFMHVFSSASSLV